MVVPIKKLITTKYKGDTDQTVTISTDKFKYVFFHVKPNIAAQAKILFRKGVYTKCWAVLRDCEYGKENLKTGERFLMKEKIKGAEYGFEN
jgi:hypothetical protein